MVATADASQRPKGRSPHTGHYGRPTACTLDGSNPAATTNTTHLRSAV